MEPGLEVRLAPGDAGGALTLSLTDGVEETGDPVEP